MRYFRYQNKVAAFDDDQVTDVELASAIASAISTLESAVEYAEFEGAKAALDAFDINTIDVEAAQSELDSSMFALNLTAAQNEYDLEQSGDNKAALDLAKAAYESCEEYAMLDAAKESLEKHQFVVQRVESAQVAYESCQEYIELERLKATKIWIPEDAVEMTDDEIYAHLNPVITDEQLAATARAKRDTLIDQVSREIERRQDAGEVVTAWREYRQFLRDIPDQSGFPKDIDWGVQPAEFTGK